MKVVDSRNNWKHVDKLLETETDEWRRHMLQQLKQQVLQQVRRRVLRELCQWV